MIITILFLLLGLGILVAGAEGLVRGASSLARRWGVSELVVGLTIVAFGTSAPELIVNLIAAFKGTADIAIGNIIGSNIANILLILGLSAVLVPLKVKGSTVWKEIPFALLAIVLVYTMGNDAFFVRSPFSAITRTDGFSLISLFTIFMFYTFGIAKVEGQPEKIKTYSHSLSYLFTVGGLIFLFVGGRILVNNAIILARLAGLSESFIGLTIVAVGTSLPELATSVVAALRRRYDIAVGNIVGSNIFNVFWVLGITSLILPLPFNVAVNFDVLVGIGATLLLFLVMFVGRRRQLDRWQGALFLFLYISYIIYLIVRE